MTALTEKERRVSRYRLEKMKWCACCKHHRSMHATTPAVPGACSVGGCSCLGYELHVDGALVGRVRRRPGEPAVKQCACGRAYTQRQWTGDLFRHALKLAERECTHVLILSAEHHVVEPEQVLEPYDCAMPTTKQMRGLWQNIASRAVARTLREMALGRAAKVLNLAGQSYALSWGAHLYLRTPELTEPLKGLSIGEQRKKLRDLLTGAVSL